MLGIIATVDSDQAALALGIKPPTVRKLIREGRLAATRFGRGWRIGVDSINALLSGAKTSVPAPTSQCNPVSSPPPAPPEPTASTTATAQSNLLTPATSDPFDLTSTTTPPVQHIPVYSSSDLRWMDYWTRMLGDANPDAVANARWHLAKFKEAAERIPPKPKPATPTRPITLAECDALLGSGGDALF
jgi:excisionase family DNA binding protein